MANFANLGNGTGKIYVVNTDGDAILSNLPNDHHGARKIKELAIQATPLSANLIASGSVKILTTGAGNVTAINVNGVNQMNGNESGGGFTVAQLATNVAANINGFTPASGSDYTALAITDTVHLFATQDTGSDANGHVVAMVTDTPANITSTDTNISGGAKASDDYDKAYGFRFWLDDSSGAVEGLNAVGVPFGTEITNQVIPRSLTNAVKTQTATIADGAVTLTRKSQNNIVIMDTEGAAATDTLTDITAAGFSEGDTVTIVGAATARVITFTNTGNLTTRNGNFASGDYSNWISFQLWKKGGAANDQWEWFEIGRSGQSVASVADLRTANLPLISTYGEATIALGTSGTTTIKANTDKQKQILTGTQTLVGNLEIALSLTDAKGGDVFWIENNAKITIGAFTYKIANITLTATQALNGGHLVLCYYDGAAWNTFLLPNLNNSATRAKLENDDLADTTIKVAKIESNLQIHQESIPISFETSEVGSLKIPMYYKGTVNKVDVYVTKAIEGTNDGSVIVKDNAGASMGSIVVTKSAAIGNNFNVSPSANNTFVAGDVLTIETAKTTAGGKAYLTLKITKT